MKIAFILTSLANVGPVIVVRDLIMALPENYVVSVYYIDNIFEIKIDRNVNFKKINYLDEINFENYEIVHSHMMRADFYAVMKRFKIKRLITTMHSDFKKDLILSHGLLVGGVASVFWYLSLFFFDRVIFLTKSQMNNYKLIKNGCVIYNGRDVPNEFIDDGSKKIINKDKIIIGACAHVVDRKGFKQVIDFLSISDDRYVFRLVGDGPGISKLIEYAKQKNVINRCEFVGRKNNVFNLIQEFDLYIMTSYSEGMPLALLEAAACGCPIVCSKIDVICEIFSDNEVSFYDLNNIISLAAAIEKAVDQGNLFSRKAFEKYVKHYTSNAMRAEYIDVYHDLLNDVS